MWFTEEHNKKLCHWNPKYTGITALSEELINRDPRMKEDIIVQDAFIIVNMDPTWAIHVTLILHVRTIFNIFLVDDNINQPSSYFRQWLVELSAITQSYLSLPTTAK